MLDENNAHVISLDGYDFCHISWEKRKGGGVGLFIKDNIHYCMIDNLTVDVEEDFEYATVKPLLKQNITASSIYRLVE